MCLLLLYCFCQSSFTTYNKKSITDTKKTKRTFKEKNLAEVKLKTNWKLTDNRVPLQCKYGIDRKNLVEAADIGQFPGKNDRHKADSYTSGPV